MSLLFHKNNRKNDRTLGRQIEEGNVARLFQTMAQGHQAVQ
nr:hypothetical protein [uncultured Aggregatibacter sp.]